MYDQVINELRLSKKIGPDDPVIVCMDTPPMAAGILGGAVGALIASTRSGHYIMAADKDGLTTFDLDKKTGTYLGTGARIEKKDIVKFNFGGALGAFNIVVKTASDKHAYSSGKKFRKYVQEEQVAKMKELFKTFYADKM